MKYYKALLAVILLISYGLNGSAPYYPNVSYTNAPSQSYQGAYAYPYGYVPYQAPIKYDTTVYPITIAGPVQDADVIVNTIKKYSDITEADANRWSFSWIPVVGPNIRNGMITKVRDFMRVCRGLRLATHWYANQNDLMTWFPGREAAVCNALNNLAEQGKYASDLLTRFGTAGDEALYRTELDKFIKAIELNQALLIPMCGRVEQQQGFKSQLQLQAARNTLEYNKTWWKTMALRWKMTKEIGTTVFNGAKWIVQTANEYSAPLATVAGAVFMYNKLFGLPQRSAAK